MTLTEEGVSGRGEAAGVHYRGESPESMALQLEALRPLIAQGVTREALCSLLPSGGARNALDCALWDLEARQSGMPAWRLAGLEAPQPLPTTCTVGADTPESDGAHRGRIQWRQTAQAEAHRRQRYCAATRGESCAARRLDRR